MNKITYQVLYTHQKTKKAKTWQDGTLEYYSSKRQASLYSDSKKYLCSFFPNPEKVEVGEELESDQYIIQLECCENEVSQSQSVKGQITCQQPSFLCSQSSVVKKPFKRPSFCTSSPLNRSNADVDGCDVYDHAAAKFATSSIFQSPRPSLSRQSSACPQILPFMNEDQFEQALDDDTTIQRRSNSSIISILQGKTKGNTAELGSCQGDNFALGENFSAHCSEIAPVMKKPKLYTTICKEEEYIDEHLSSTPSFLENSICNESGKGIDDVRHMATTLTNSSHSMSKTEDRLCNPRQMVVSCDVMRFHEKSVVVHCNLPLRQLEIPLQVKSVLAYQSLLQSVIIEMLNVQMFELSQRYHLALDQIELCIGQMKSKSAVSVPICLQHRVKARRSICQKAGKNQGRAFFGCGSTSSRCNFFRWLSEAEQKCRPKIYSWKELTDYLLSQKINFYNNCQISTKTMQRPAEMGKQFSYLKIEKKAAHDYNKGDVWIISADVQFSKSIILKSKFFGPTSELDIEVEAVTGVPLPQGQCCALYFGNASTQFDCLHALDNELDPRHVPVLNYLTTNPSISSHSSFTLPMPEHQMMALARDFAAENALNEDQTEALQCCTNLLTKSPKAPIAIIHGVFGSGKSRLLVIVVRFMMDLIQKCGAECRLMIASLTNVAVDRILLGLLDCGFEQFVRVGSLRKIDKGILPFSMNSLDSSSQELAELRLMLKENLTSSERLSVRKAIENHEKGENKKKLLRAPVVGITCASCMVKSLEELRFQIVLLDECSQLTEPMSLLPILKASCERLIIVGDPKQLDPTIEGGKCAHSHGLEQTMMDRLVLSGHPSLLLRTQYRCHPTISCLANRLFYNGHLIDGISAADRPSILPLPPVCMVICSPAYESWHSGSYQNVTEAGVVENLLNYVTGMGTDGRQVGVIALYRAQAALIQQSQQSGVLVSTVDAFQGGERSIIILSTVRTKFSDFIECPKRLNVALTRAMHHLVIVISSSLLKESHLWQQILTYCQGMENGVIKSNNLFKNIL